MLSTEKDKLHTCLKLISLFTLVLSLPCFVFDGRFLIGFLRMWMLYWIIFRPVLMEALEDSGLEGDTGLFFDSLN